MLKICNMKLKKNVAVSETGFLFDPNTGESFSLNETGKFIVRLFSEGKSEKDVIETVMQKYDVDAHSLQRYMDDFMLMLGQFNLTEKEGN